MQRTTLSLAALLTLSTALVAAPPAAASGSCFSASFLGGSAAGSVSTTDTSDWYYHHPVGLATYTLFPFAGDADLYVYNFNCTQVLCSSAAGGSTIDKCTAFADLSNPLNPHKVEVRYWSSSSGSVSYVLQASP